MKKIIMIVIAIGLLLFSVGCGSNGEIVGEGKKGTVEIGYVAWDCATATSNVMKVVLEDMGYDVILTDASVALLYQGLANGDIDFTANAWLPFTHAAFIEEHGDKLVDVASNYNNDAKIGLVVPTYMDINSVEDLADGSVAGGVITGIDPGAGLMSATENAIEEYSLNVKLLEGTDAIMAAALQDAINNQEEVVVTGWAPHWKFGRWDLKFLDDPKKVFGEAEDIRTMSRVGLEEDMPEVYEFISKFNWDASEIATVMDMNSEGMDPAESARIWVDNNQDRVSTWIE